LYENPQLLTKIFQIYIIDRRKIGDVKAVFEFQTVYEDEFTSDKMQLREKRTSENKLHVSAV